MIKSNLIELKKEYIEIGKCIWCLKEKPEVTFNNEPHTVSRQLDATNIGFDICDSCNSYFGTHSKDEPYPINVELAYKEVFNVIRHLMPNKVESHKRLKSRFFNYYKSKRLFKINNNFKYRPGFIKLFTRQFKRGVYETFLQEYHLHTKNGLDKRFDSIRDFARHDKGNIPLYFVDHEGAIITSDNENPYFAFNELLLENINTYGFYTLNMYGFWFYLEVTTRAEFSRDIFLKNEYYKRRMPNPFASGIKELKYITDLDFTLKKLSNS